MKGTRHQEGYLYRKGSLWLLRYYDSEVAADGSVRRVQKTKKLATFGLECPNKTAARDLAREFLESINLARNTPESAMTLINSPKIVICPLSRSTSGSEPSVAIGTCGGVT